MWLAVLICSVGLLWAVPVHADLYLWTDAEGTVHAVDDRSGVPKEYRKQVKIYREVKRPPVPESPATPPSPDEISTDGSQGSFARKLALDLGLIRKTGEDPFRLLRNLGIRPADGWQADEPLTPEVYYEVLAAARRAADSGRLALSADGAEAIVRLAASSFLPSASIAQAAPSDEEEERPYRVRESDSVPVVIVEPAPPTVIEVVVEPYYVPVFFWSTRFGDHGRHDHSRFTDHHPSRFDDHPHPQFSDPPPLRDPDKPRRLFADPSDKPHRSIVTTLPPTRTTLPPHRATLLSTDPSVGFSDPDFRHSR